MIRLLAEEHRPGEDFKIVTPAIRPVGDEPGDQKRIATPRGAILAGADHLVVGRPILQAMDMASKARAIMDEIEQAVQEAGKAR